jgi:hypothetical protein
MNEAVRHEVDRLRVETGWRIDADTTDDGRVTLTLRDDLLLPATAPPSPLAHPLLYLPARQ